MPDTDRPASAANQSSTGFLRWLWLALPVFAILFGCGQLALLTTPPAAPGQTGSALRADYGPWDFLAIQPVQAALAQAAIQDQFGPAAVLPVPQVGIFRITTGPGVIQPLPTALPSATAPVVVSLISQTPSASLTPALTPEMPSPSPSASPSPSSSPSATQTVLLVMPTRTPSQTLGPLAAATATGTTTRTPGLSFTATPRPSATIHNLPTYTTTPSATQTLTATLTPIPTDTPTLTPTVTETPTPTASQTPSITPSETPTSTPSLVPTDTPVPSATPNLCLSNIPSGEPDIGLPDGQHAYLGCGAFLVVDLGQAGLDASNSDPAPDLIYYERANPSQPDTIALDWVTLQLGERDASGSCASADWVTVFQWGDGDSNNNGHLGASYPEGDNQPIPLSALHGSGSLQSGIEIDVNAHGANGVYGCLRVVSPINWPANDGAEIDAFELIQP